MYESMILSTKNFLTILKFLKLGLKKLSKNSKNEKIGKILYRCATTTHPNFPPIFSFLIFLKALFYGFFKFFQKKFKC